MTRKCLLAAIAFAAPLHFPAQAQEITRAPAVGEPGGGGFEVLCPEGQIVTGLAVRGGASVDAVAPLCVTALNSRQTRPGSLQAMLPFHGGAGGQEVRLDCPLGYPAISGVGVKRERTPREVDGLSLLCKTADAAQRRGGGDFDGVTEAERQRMYGDIRQHDYPPGSHCERGQVAVGIYGRSGRLLEQFGLVCSPPVIRNPSVTDKARAILGQRAGDLDDEASQIAEPRAGTQAAPSAKGVAEALNPQPLPPREALVGDPAAGQLGAKTSLNPQPLPPRTSKLGSGVGARAVAAQPEAPSQAQPPHN